MRAEQRGSGRMKPGAWRQGGVALGVLASCVATLAADSPGAGSGAVVSPAIHQAGAEELRPAVSLPLEPSPLPDRVRLDFSARSALGKPVAWPVTFRGTGLPPPGAGSLTAVPPRISGFSHRLMARMVREARRYRGEHLFDGSGGRFPLDSAGEDQRAREAERIFTRALDKTLDDQVEHLARTSLGLGGFLDWLDDLGGLRLGSGRPASARNDLVQAAQAAGDGSAPRDVPAFHGNLGLRLGAHPRIVMKTEFLGIRGRLEVPVLDGSLRLSFERPLGPRSRAALNGGRSRDGDDWAAITFNCSF